MRRSLIYVFALVFLAAGFLTYLRMGPYYSGQARAQETAVTNQSLNSVNFANDQAAGPPVVTTSQPPLNVIARERVAQATFATAQPNFANPSRQSFTPIATQQFNSASKPATSKGFVASNMNQPFGATPPQRSEAPVVAKPAKISPVHNVEPAKKKVPMRQLASANSFGTFGTVQVPNGTVLRVNPPVSTTPLTTMKPKSGLRLPATNQLKGDALPPRPTPTRTEGWRDNTRNNLAGNLVPQKLAAIDHARTLHQTGTSPESGLPSIASKVQNLVRAQYRIPVDAARNMETFFAFEGNEKVETKTITIEESEGLVDFQVTTDAKTQKAIAQFLNAIYPATRIDRLKKESAKAAEPRKEFQTVALKLPGMT